MRTLFLFLIFTAVSELIAQQPVPSITGVLPSSAYSGSNVVLSGKNLNGDSSQIVVRFGGVKAKIVQNDSTTIVAEVPKGAQYGSIDVTIKGLSAVAPRPFLPLFPNSDSLYSGSFIAPTFQTAQTSPSCVAAGDLNGDGLLDVVVSNDGSASVTINQNISKDRNILFRAPFFRAVGSAPHMVTLADVDGDGRLDILTANRSGNSITILKNIHLSGIISSGSFAAPVELPTGTSPFSVAVGDLDLDGRNDIVVANNGSNSVSVYRNTSILGTLSFAPRTDLLFGNAPYAAVIGDMNGDRFPEIIISNYGSNTLSVLMNMAKNDPLHLPSFPVEVQLTCGASPSGVVIGDVNNDSIPDLITANTVGNTISILKGTGITPDTITASSFSPKQDFSAPVNPMGVSLGNMNGDAKVDILFTNWNSAAVGIFQNYSSTDSVIVAPKITLPAGDAPKSVVAADLNLDGRPEVLATSWNNHNWVIYENTVGIPIAPANLTAKPGNENIVLVWKKSKDPAVKRYNIYQRFTVDSVVLIDSVKGEVPDTSFTVNGLAAGKLHTFLVTAVNNSGSESKFSNSASAVPYDSVAPGAPKMLRVLDSLRYHIVIAWQKGPEKDIAFYRIYIDSTLQQWMLFDSTKKHSNDTVKAIEPRTFKSFNITISAVDVFGNESAFSNVVSAKLKAAPEIIPMIGHLSSLRAKTGDSLVIFGKGLLSVPQQPIVRIAKNNAKFVRSDSVSITVKVPNGAQYGPVTADVNGYSLTSPSMLLPVFAGGGTVSTASFESKMDFSSYSTPSGNAMGDLNGDGRLDIAITNDGGSILSVFQNNTLQSPFVMDTVVELKVGLAPHQVVMADIDGDGRLDMVTANRGGASISVIRNIHTSGRLKSSSFDSSRTFESGDQPFTVSCADIDQDGRMDIASANYGSGTVSVFRNIGYPGYIAFAPKVDFTVGNGPFTVLLQDINGDRKPDIITSNYHSNTVTLLRNVTSPLKITPSSFTSSSNMVTGSSPAGMVAADINGDSLNDLIVANVTGNSVSVFKSLPAVSDSILAKYFAPNVAVPAGVNPMGIAAGNLNGDDRVDIVVTNWNGGHIAMFQNNSSVNAISLASKVDLVAGDGARAVTIGDVDNDDKPEMVVSCWAANHWSIYRNRSGEQLSASDQQGQLPRMFALQQNYPNPFNPSTTLSYELPMRARVLLEVFNILGQRIMTVVNASQEPGRYSAVLSMNNPSGIYFYRLTATSPEGGSVLFTKTRSLLLVR